MRPHSSELRTDKGKGSLTFYFLFRNPAEATAVRFLHQSSQCCINFLDLDGPESPRPVTVKSHEWMEKILLRDEFLDPPPKSMNFTHVTSVKRHSDSNETEKWKRFTQETNTFLVCVFFKWFNVMFSFREFISYETNISAFILCTGWNGS